jgi:hypothetical protein
MTLRVTIEVVPHGDESRKHSIHVLNIHNTGTKTWAGATRYAVDLDGWRLDRMFLHDREDGALVLIRRVFDNLHKAKPQSQGDRPVLPNDEEVA